MPISSSWHQTQIKLYTKEFPFFEIYAHTILNILEAASHIYAPLAIVQARPKSISSFAEKAVRKSDKYQAPVEQLTDLCGGRIITHTQGQVEEICRFIEEHFEVDWANSLDVRSRLSTSEFGYLSHHYVVQVKRDSILGIPVPLAQIGERKAEIQVRTLLQHAWADILHDRIYKSGFRVPEGSLREGARMAAVLETADRDFAFFTAEFDRYKLNYSAYMNAKERDTEIATLQLILANEPAGANKPALALQIAGIAKTSGDWNKIINVLKPYFANPAIKNKHLADSIDIEYGYACCRLHQAAPHNAEFNQGLDILQKFADSFLEKQQSPDEQSVVSRKLLSKGLTMLAWCSSVAKAGGGSRYYDLALQLDPGNPYILANCLLSHMNTVNTVNLIRNSIIDAIATCRRHIQSGLELPLAFFTIGRLHFSLRDFENCMSAYLEAIQYCRQNREARDLELFNNELNFLSQSGFDDLFPFEFRWIEQILHLGKAVLYQTPEAMQAIVNYSRRNVLVPGDVDLRDTASIKSLPREAPPKDIQAPVLILAGGTYLTVEAEIAAYEPLLKTALEGWSGTTISGGTDEGVPGMLGRVASALNADNAARAGAGSIKLLGYIPRSRLEPRTGQSFYLHTGFQLVVTREKQYAIGHPVQYWTDIVASGIQPADVKLIGINGGIIAGMEFRMALALGAQAAIFEGSGRAASDIFRDERFNACPNLLNVPKDAYSLRALVISPASRLKKENLVDAAKQIHENYLNKIKSADPGQVQWDELEPSLKNSNIHQARYCEEVLRSCGYAVREAAGPIEKPFYLDPGSSEENQKKAQTEIEIMAEIEHGRWNAERLLSGWRYGTEKDLNRKISPYLVPWDILPDDIKEYDRVNILNYYSMLAKAKLEIFRP